MILALVTDVVKREDIPHEKGEWMDLRRLSWTQLQVATEAQSDATMKRLKNMGGDMAKALRDTAKKEKEARSNPDPRAIYDRGVVLEAGIVAWSYGPKVNKENIDKLDEPTAKWAFETILDLNKPRSEEESKNA